MTLNQVTFTHGLVAIGLILIAAIAFDIVYRGPHRWPHPPQWPLPDANAKLGHQAIIDHGCGSCHVIPSVGLATGRVGPKLDDFVNQSYIAGILPNNADNLVKWIRHPEQVNPDTAMPNLGVSENDARNIAAYLYQAR